jgi:hypothetical protein
LDAEPRYAIEKLVHVLREMGCDQETSKVDPNRLGWINPSLGQPGLHVGVFTVENGRFSIRQDHVVAIALSLRLDPDEVIRKLKRSGGELL